MPSSRTSSIAHTVPVAGLRASTDYLVSVRTVSDGSTRTNTVGEPVAWRSGELPSDLPRLRLSRDRARMSPGLTLFNLIPWHVPNLFKPAIPLALRDRSDLGYVIAVDDDGHIVWYYRAGLGIDDARQLPNGDLLLNYDDCVARQVNVLGETVREWASLVATEWMPTDELGRPRTQRGTIPIATDSMHHEVAFLPSGNLLFLSSELRKIHDPSGRRCGGTTRYDVIGDVVVEADPRSGAIVREWRLLDVVDPLRRPGTHLCAGGLRHTPPIWFYPEADYPRDWSHGNAVVLDQSRNTLLVSARHLDAIFALRYEEDATGPAGELLWEFGPHGSVELGQGEWPYHHHAIELQDDGSLLLYDNGVGRPGHTGENGEPHPFSRAVQFNIDVNTEGRYVATQRWEYRHTTHDRRPAFSRRLGDADRLPNGNVLITHGHLKSRLGRISARIMEVAPEGPAGGDVVFDLTVDGTDNGWSIYRAQRISSLYPHLYEQGRGTK